MIDLGFENLEAGDTTTRVRLLVARAFWPFAFRTGPRGGRRGSGSARRRGRRGHGPAAGRPDLASAALDAARRERSGRGDYGGQQRILERRLALVPKLSDPFELGDLYAVAAWGEFHVGRYAATLANADQGVGPLRGHAGRRPLHA